VPAEASGQPDNESGDETGRITEVQPAERASVSDARRLPAILGKSDRGIRRGIFGRLVYTNDEVSVGADEEDRQDDQAPPRPDPELV